MSSVEVLRKHKEQILRCCLIEDYEEDEELTKALNDALLALEEKESKEKANRLDAVNTGALGFREGWKNAILRIKRYLDRKKIRSKGIDDLKDWINQELKEISEAEKGLLK